MPIGDPVPGASGLPRRDRRRQVLVTRPAEDAEPLRAPIEARGLVPLTEPLLDIQPADPAEIAPALLDPTGLSAVLFTSANGVRALARLSGGMARDLARLPCFAVGDATARTARAAGFADVRSAGGDVTALAALVIASLDPASTRGLLHPAGSVTAGDLAGRLQAAGFADVRRVAVYRAVASPRLSDMAVAALRHGTVRAALFFSPRTADLFVRLMRAQKLDATVADADALCLSPAVADRLDALPFARIRVADRPEQQNLLDLLDLTAPPVDAGADRGGRKAGGLGVEPDADGCPG